MHQYSFVLLDRVNKRLQTRRMRHSLKNSFCLVMLLSSFVSAEHLTRKIAEVPKPERPAPVESGKRPKDSTLATLKGRGDAYCAQFQKILARPGLSQACKARLDLEAPASQRICQSDKYQGLESSSAFENPLVNFPYLLNVTATLGSDLNNCGNVIESQRVNKTLLPGIIAFDEALVVELQITLGLSAEKAAVLKGTWSNYAKALIRWYSEGNQ